jgi:hypothetical protein
MVSVVPPAGAPTKILMGGCGWACAPTAQAAQTREMPKNKARREVVDLCEVFVCVMWLSFVSSIQFGT